VLGPDEPRYAAIGREMARSGDWITPRLWGEPWFEKPALIYWMSGAGFRLGLGDELAPRAPATILGVLFLGFFYWSLRREFDGRAAAIATAILGTSAGWLAYSYVATPDLTMSALFSTAMLLGMIWLRSGAQRWLIAAAAALGLAALAKGLVPLALAIPFAWQARTRWKELLGWKPLAAFFAIAAPWYALCYARNGSAFIHTFFWEHHVGRFASTALQHVQPSWFYVPVLLAALFPWTPAVALLLRPGFYSDSRRRFLLLWVVFGLVFFSAFLNKLPGYILPLLPAAAALAGIAISEGRRSRWIVALSAGLLCFVFPVAALLPRALAAGLSRSDIPVWSVWWAAPAALAVAVYYVERRTAVALVTAALIVGVIYLKLAAFPAIDAAASARSLWLQIAPKRDRVCVEDIHRSWRYGLNYYSINPLPECDVEPRPARVTQVGGAPASLTGE
jgi:4-amino-4-deoxy-L-arabinose transferase-like glycosyltransferase